MAIFLKEAKKKLCFLWRLFLAAWFPVTVFFLLLAWVIFTTHHQSQEISQTVWALVLGVVLGFLIDMIKKSIDDFDSKEKLRAASLYLLKEDAKNAYTLLYVYSGIQFDPGDSPPPQIPLSYWKILKLDSNFLLQAADERFNRIFEFMRFLEFIDQQRTEGDTNKIQKKQNPYSTANSWYKKAWEGIPAKMVTCCMEQEEFNSFDKAMKQAFEENYLDFLNRHF